MLTRYRLSALLGHVPPPWRVVQRMWAAILAGDLSLRAMSLVYTTLMSVVPCLALGFSLLKALGAHNALLPMLMESLRALGPQQSYRVANQVVAFVEQVQVEVLGWLGVAFLVVSALSLITKLEASINWIWRAPPPRALLRRMSEYLALLIMGPLAVAAVLGGFASGLDALTPWVPIADAMRGVVSSVIPFAVTTAMLCFLYVYLPNTRVRWRPAVFAGLLAGGAWQVAGWIFASWVSYAANFNAIYSGFAIGLFVLTWIYVGWLVLLLGAQLSYFLQHPWGGLPGDVGAAAQSEQWALAAMHHLARAFDAGLSPPDKTALAAGVGLPESELAPLLAPWLASGMLLDAGTHWTLARAPHSVTVKQLWRDLRGPLAEGRGPDADAAAGWLRGNTDEPGLTLAEWVRAHPHPPMLPEAPAAKPLAAASAPDSA